MTKEWVDLELVTQRKLFACAGPDNSVVVKLGVKRVKEEIETDHGLPYGPSGRAFTKRVITLNASSTQGPTSASYVRDRFEALEGTAAS